MAEANLQAVYQFPNYPYTCQNRPGLRMCFSVGIASGVWGPLDTALVLGWGIDSALSPPPDMDFISYYIALESDRHSLITVTMFYYCGVLLLIVFFPASKSFSRLVRGQKKELGSTLMKKNVIVGITEPLVKAGMLITTKPKLVPTVALDFNP
ncbi:hypothetical protein MRB53_010919 [Persea americana]|uniref:Uncharacterized protein n=1 Tax=Persea americana TaxID=3435 RepID=A0ACC2LTC5_PERAE|nr:hypothetical protein MRB53_010919 [Persea americana]